MRLCFVTLPGWNCSCCSVLNRAYFGRLAYGIEAASLQYFGKPAEMIDIAETATLIALLQSPTGLNPNTNPHELAATRQYVLDQGLSNTVISPLQYANASHEELHFVTSEAATNTLPNCLKSFLDSELTTTLNEQALGDLDRSNLVIYTTLDRDILHQAISIANRHLQNIKPEHNVSNAASVAINPNDGSVISYACNTSTNSSTADLDLVQSLRQPGSAIKPVTYLNALSSGITLGDFLHDQLQTFYTGKEQAYVPENYDQSVRGDVTLRDALGSSLNIPAVELLEKTGIDTFLKTAQAMGISTFTNRNSYDLALTLGGAEVTLYELTTLYSSLANKLTYQKPHLIEKILDHNDREIYSHINEPIPNILGIQSVELSYLITDVLEDNNARRFSFSEVNPLVTTKKSAAKTGTTQDFRDNWTVGYNQAIAIGVWTGNADHTPMNNISGIQGAAPIWHDLMELFIKEGLYSWPDQPSGLEKRETCLNISCTNQRTELFLSGTNPADPPIANNKQLQITYPYNQQEFLINPSEDLAQYEKLTLKAAGISGSAFTWYLNDIPLGRSVLQAGIGFVSWTPVAGTHHLQVIDDFTNQQDDLYFTVTSVTNGF